MKQERTRVRKQYSKEARQQRGDLDSKEDKEESRREKKKGQKQREAPNNGRERKGGRVSERGASGRREKKQRVRVQRRKWTLNRSPHGNKTAREQFGRESWKRSRKRKGSALKAVEKGVRRNEQLELKQTEYKEV